MRHRKAIQLLESFHRAEIDAADRARLENHLASCAGCAREAEASSAFSDLLADAALTPTEEEFEAALRSVRQGTMLAIREAEQTSALPLLAALWPFRASFMPVSMAAGMGAALLVAVLALPLAGGIGRPDRAPDGRDQAVVGAPSPDFRLMAKAGSVEIEWPRNGRKHRIRKADDPREVSDAEGDLVRGRVWSERDGTPAPGSVTYYLVD